MQSSFTACTALQHSALGGLSAGPDPGTKNGTHTLRFARVVGQLGSWDFTTWFCRTRARNSKASIAGEDPNEATDFLTVAIGLFEP